jgi:hypothetical protein
MPDGLVGACTDCTAAAQTILRYRWQNLPYVKIMVSALVALNGACKDAVHNKERCLSLAGYAIPSRDRATTF